MHMDLFFRMGSGNKRGEMAEESCEMRSSVHRLGVLKRASHSKLRMLGERRCGRRGWGMNAFSDSYTVCSVPAAGFAVFGTISVGGDGATTV